MDSESSDERYAVVVNHDGQYSIWRLGRELPVGWQQEGFTGSEAACLSHIGEIWTDMTPFSVRGESATT